MAFYDPAPEPEICLECGGKIPYRNVHPPPPRNNCPCPCCMVIGPGPRPLWSLDKENHICQERPDKKAIAKARQKPKTRLRWKFTYGGLAEASKKRKRSS